MHDGDSDSTLCCTDPSAPILTTLLLSLLFLYLHLKAIEVMGKLVEMLLHQIQEVNRLVGLKSFLQSSLLFWTSQFLGRPKHKLRGWFLKLR